MLKYFRTRQASIFRDVAHQDGWHVLALGGEEELCRRFPDLPDAARRRLELGRPHRLHRVHDDERRLEARDFLQDPLDACFGQQIEGRLPHAETVAAALHLMFGFLARRVEHGADVAREVGGRLEQQRGLADAGLAAEQDQRTGNDAAAEHAIELLDAAREPLGLRRLDFAVELCRARGAELRVAVSRSLGSRFRGTLLDQRIPRAAVGASAHPLRGLRAALLAHEYDFGRFHRAWLRVFRPASSSVYCRSTRVPSRQTISHGIVPIDAAISRASILCHDSPPCSPRITTSSPGTTSSRPVTSTVIMSIDTAPTTGTRWPRISTDPRPPRRVSRPSA